MFEQKTRIYTNGMCLVNWADRDLQLKGSVDKRATAQFKRYILVYLSNVLRKLELGLAQECALLAAKRVYCNVAHFLLINRWLGFVFLLHAKED